MMIALEELGIFQILLLKVEDKQNLTHPQSKSPINQLSGCGALFFLLTRLFEIGRIPIYIGIKFNFVLCELDVRRILSSHNHLHLNEWVVHNQDKRNDLLPKVYYPRNDILDIFEYSPFVR